jgi:hypothetical protein
VLFHLEVGDAVAQQAADAVALLEQGHAWPARASCWAQARPAGPEPTTATLAGLLRRRLRLDPAFFPAAVDDLAFDGFDGDRVVVDVQRAGRLAGRGADAAGEFREIVGGVQVVERRRHWSR